MHQKTVSTALEPDFNQERAFEEYIRAKQQLQLTKLAVYRLARIECNMDEN